MKKPAIGRFPVLHPLALGYVAKRLSCSGHIAGMQNAHFREGRAHMNSLVYMEPVRIKRNINRITKIKLGLRGEAAYCEGLTIIR